MKLGIAGANRDKESTSRTSATIATEELQLRIQASGLAESLTGLACDLCVQQVEVEQVFECLQERAIERMVSMLDTGIFENDRAVDDCMAMIARESEKVAWEALENCTEVMQEGLKILEGIENVEDTAGYVH